MQRTYIDTEKLAILFDTFTGRNNTGKNVGVAERTRFNVRKKRFNILLLSGVLKGRRKLYCIGSMQEH